MIRIGNKVVAGSADVDLSTVLKSLNKTGLSIWIGTQTEHDALAESVKNNEKTTFITYDTDEDIYLIIDTIISYGKTWSSVKISSELAKKINASDVYTKEQVDEIISAKLASALKYRGAVNTTALLPGSAENGDTYFVKADGFMYAYNSTTSSWDALGTVADMTNYFTKSEITAMLQDKADKFQYDVLPTASSETVGLLLQYTGADTQDYKNGYFYKGIDNGNDTYGWELAKICDCYSKSEVDDSGLCAHGDNAPFLTNSTIKDYLTGLDAKYKFATFTVDKDNTTVSDKVNTTQWFSYNCYRQNTSWKVTAADSSTGKEIYTTDISAGNTVSWSKLATTDEVGFISLLYNQSTDILAYALTCPQEKRTLVRIYSVNATNNPYGVSTETDFIYEIDKINFGNLFITVRAKDVKNNREFINTKNETEWSGWQEVATQSMLPEFKNMATGDANELRSFADGKLYSLRVSTAFNVIDDDGTTYQIPALAEALFYKHSGDATVQFHSYYGTPGIWEVFYNSNGLTRGKKIV